MRYSMQSSPAWSIGGRKANQPAQQAPGPGAYQPSNMHKTPQYKIGSSARSDFTKQQLQNPGPGSYQLKPKSNTQNVKFGIESREKLASKDIIPGPGAYQSSQGMQGPQYTLKGRYPEKFPSQVPGPGSYNFNSDPTKQRPLTAKMGSQSRSQGNIDTVRQNYPGPGSYNTNKLSGNPTWKFGSSQRGKQTSIFQPGPGAYQIPTSFSQKSFSMKGRHPTKSTQLQPGPGAYDTNQRGNLASYSIPKAARGAHSGDLSSPGPGAYNPTSKKTQTGTFIGSSERQKIGNPEFTPGPGAYYGSAKAEGPQFSMGGKTQEQIRLEIPGPGAYDPKSNKIASPNYKLGSAKRGNSSITRQNVPGPGTYSQDNLKVTKQSPNWKFGSQNRFTYRDGQNPGPGSYQAQSGLSKSAATMKGRTKEKKVEDQPGPGAYQSEPKEKVPTFSIGKAERGEIQSNQGTPGPGTYNAGLQNSQPGIFMGSGGRKAMNPSQNTPGPGSYYGVPKSEGPQFSMVGRKKQVQKQANPGPGTYESEAAKKLSSATPNWKFGSSVRTNEKPNPSPGPGAYNKEAALSKKAFTMSGRLEKPAIQSHPGPGAYDSNSRNKIQSYSIGKSNRGELQQRDEFPGPGTYREDKVDTSSPQWKFGTDKRTKQKQTNQVGPGAYEVIKTGNTPGWTLQGKHEGNWNNSETPGPGTYQSPQIIGKGTPAFKVGSGPKTGDYLQNQSPGPGAYEPKTGLGTPLYSVGREQRGVFIGGKGDKQEPGPGYYNIRGKPSGPEWKFGTDQKGKVQEGGLPGPGQYEVKSTILDVPKYLMSPNI